MSPLHAATPPPRFAHRPVVNLAGRISEDEWGEYWSATEGPDARPAIALLMRPDLQRSRRVLAALRAGIQRCNDVMASNPAPPPTLAAFRQILNIGAQAYVLAPPVEGTLPFASTGSWAEFAPIAADIAELLDRAHARGLVHGHVSMPLVLVRDGRLAGLLGWGANSAALNLRSDFPSTRAPELARPGAVPDDASDQYAFAVALRDALADAPDLPATAAAAFARATAPRPRDRFASCADLVRAIDGQPVAAKRPLSTAALRARRRIVTGVVAGVLGLAVLAGVAFGVAAAMRKSDDAAAEAAAAAGVAPADAGTGAPRPAARFDPFANAPAVATPGRNWRSSDGIEFVWVPDLSCWVGRYEVANAEYRVMDPGHSSGSFRGCDLDGDRQPAVRLNFDEMCAFAQWLTDREAAAGHLPEGWRFRLPTREESIACIKAGYDRPFPWGDAFPPPNGAGNYADEAFSEQFPADPAMGGYRDGAVASCPVEESGENAWGLFGVSGNVWETTAAEPENTRFGGWHGGAFDIARADQLVPDAFYGYMGAARGAVNGFRLLLAPAPAP